ncbi:hypothetical protein PR003_g20211 [Phytophthora rubi]|uniref:Uncharacterized protein n=1 Tax=Phytophthora rubi TaxID=129364 RepID=A0A6A3JZE5_9STRA|nr:hypothetical protein PR002_g19579 [Phytophthora rubi]KAE8999262.1 hypothetical protein PR001_g19111 [Phytophthora rubi]KAE9310697.1 hypothetical protein PR003_g20211 [Phytophthora rubi]
MWLSRTHCTFTSLSAAPLRAHDCGGATKTKMASGALLAPSPALTLERRGRGDSTRTLVA